MPCGPRPEDKEKIPGLVSEELLRFLGGKADGWQPPLPPLPQINPKTILPAHKTATEEAVSPGNGRSWGDDPRDGHPLYAHTAAPPTAGELPGEFEPVQALLTSFAYAPPELRPFFAEFVAAAVDYVPTIASSRKRSGLVLLDESGFRLGSPPHYGWSPVGERSPGKTTHDGWWTMTMIGALALDGWRGFITIGAPTDHDVFLAFVEQELAGNLRPGDLAVMDDLFSHKHPDVIAAIRAAGADVFFLPPYSPELNPIEKAWAKLKELIHRASTHTREASDRAVAAAMDAISTAGIRARTKHAGYGCAAA